MKKYFIIFCILNILTTLTGCKTDNYNLNNDAEDILFGSPCTKQDGSRFRLAYVDYDQYIPACRQLYYILEGLRKRGWIICDDFPFEADTLSSKEMIECLTDMDLGPYIEFDFDAFYYLAYQKEEDIKESLINHTETVKDIDLVLTFGTNAGLFVKKLNLSVPMVNFSATDPITSGIINSTVQGSGSDNIWAQIEPSMPLRQLEYYHSLKAFDKLGIIIYGNEVISGLPDIEKASKKVGFELIKYNIAETERVTLEQQNAYYQKVRYYIEKIIEENIDAFFLTVDLINDFKRLEELLNLFYESNIPVFVMDDTNAVKNGALLIISTYDFENVGYFIADAVVQILSGAKAGDLPCVYVSAPYICLNYNVAKKINFPLDIKFLMSCDEIYSENMQNQ